MSGTDIDLSLVERIEDRLLRIANVLLLNASFIDNPGLLNGKMGIAIFFYHYAKYTTKKIYKDYADELIDEIYEDINTSTPVNFENGLTGIGWGIEYLVNNKFVEADTDEALIYLDNEIYRHRINSPILISKGNDLFGYGFYYISRILGHKIDDDDLNTLIKKYHLIFLTDECERILEQKTYTRLNIESLGIDCINSFIWFLLEIKKLNVFPFKVDKLLKTLPDHIEPIVDASEDRAGLRLLAKLTENIKEEANYALSNGSLKEIIENSQNSKDNKELVPAKMISYFIKNTWQGIIYNPYYAHHNFRESQFESLFEIIDTETNWKSVLDRLTSENMGLTGLAGLGLGLLKAQSRGHRAKGSELPLSLKLRWAKQSSE
ncbi:MAG: hypothetical protein JXB49_15660 [Bacteroidales bacterium]|nr:hypothetical protein [Bacteroidales bacterium]